MRRYLLILILTVILLFFGARPAFAVDVTISNVPSTVTDQPFEFNVSVNGAQAGTNYLRANFFPTGTIKYFGYTYNGSSFVNSSNCRDYFPITIDSSGDWSGTVQAKIDTSSSYYYGPGSYSFKVRRYTQSCSSSYIWSNEVTTQVSISSSMPSPTSTPTQTPTSSPISNSTSFTISNNPSQINSDQSFNVSVSLSLPNNPNTTFYLKGAFKKADGSNYFGLTKVSGSWIKNGSAYSNQYSITTDSSGNWSGNLEIQSDTEDSGYTGSGDYIFKVARYTSSGSGPIWSNETTIKIVSIESNNRESNNGETLSSGTSSYARGQSASSSVKSKTNISDQSKSYDTLVYHTATVAAATTSASPNIAVKGEQRINFTIWIGAGLVVVGIALSVHIYLHNKNLYETISNVFRKRN